MSSIAYITLGACLGSVISVFALITGVVADDKTTKVRHKEAEAEAYKEGVIAGSRWKEAEKAMIEQAVKELRAEVEELERVNELKK